PVEDQGLDPVPATGPYMISEAGADGIELVRNPAFREWSGGAQPDSVVHALSWRFEQDVANAFDRLSSGELDWMTDEPKPADLASLQAAHPGQVVLWPAARTGCGGAWAHPRARGRPSRPPASRRSTTCACGRR